MHIYRVYRRESTSKNWIDNYGLLVPDDDFITELSEDNSMCLDDIIKHLRMYLTVDVTD